MGERQAAAGAIAPSNITIHRSTGWGEKLKRAGRTLVLSLPTPGVK
jgi:hypothetical protein